MDAIQALTQRASCNSLVAPGPTEEQKGILFRAALRAADHGRLQPWRFLVIEGEGLDALGEVFLKNAEAEGELTEAQRKRCLAMPHRAPLIVVAISKAIEHPKVPVFEQQWATAAAVQNMITAAYAQGLGAYWRTGAQCESPVLKHELGLQAGEAIVGFVYLGTVETQKVAQDVDPQAFFTSWPK